MPACLIDFNLSSICAAAAAAAAVVYTFNVVLH